MDGRTWTKTDVPKDAMPDVAMKSGALVTSDGRVLWSRQVDEQRAMASITKIMTAIVAIEHSKPDDVITVPNLSATIGESTSGLYPGQKLSMAHALEALLIKSGNDAAIAIEIHVGGTREGFVKLMNEKAAELGMSNTNFTNAHGLDENGHHSSARDISVMARYAMQFDEFKKIVNTKEFTNGTGSNKKTMQSTNLLLFSYDGANGVKTGWTDKAGYCVVDSATRGGIELYAVVLGTSGELVRFNDARDLLDFGFTHYRKQNISVKGTVVGQAVVSDYLDRKVPVAIPLEKTIPIFDLSGDITRTLTIPEVSAPVVVGESIGAVQYTQDGKLICSMPLVATEDVEKPNIFMRVWYGIVRGWRAIFN